MRRGPARYTSAMNLRSTFALAAALLLSGCGNKGPLVMAPAPAANPAEAPVAPPADSAVPAPASTVAPAVESEPQPEPQPEPAAPPPADGGNG